MEPFKIKDIDALSKKARWVAKKTLQIHKVAPGTRLASSLSCVEILTALFYGGILRYDPKSPLWQDRDRFVISKAHGSVSFYPILADLGYIAMEELERVGQNAGTLGDIPDCSIPGYETVNGSLGHGLGVASGMALALKKKGHPATVFVLSGDGEFYEGSVWEAVMFSAHHRLGNLIVVVDNNKRCMLDYCRNIIQIEPIEKKLEEFGWQTASVDGHDLDALTMVLDDLKKDDSNRPKLLVANTVKGKGVPRLETDPLCHIKSLSSEEIDHLIMEMS